ncbi:uncharacterized protein [Zea mays]|nr:uncharacterized protein LOC109939258 [Zea mays]XP_035820339.1 uncharacterized protein LOC109939258 [Zea mays]
MTSVEIAAGAGIVNGGALLSSSLLHTSKSLVLPTSHFPPIISPSRGSAQLLHISILTTHTHTLSPPTASARSQRAWHGVRGVAIAGVSPPIPLQRTTSLPLQACHYNRLLALSLPPPPPCLCCASAAAADFVPPSSKARFRSKMTRWWTGTSSPTAASTGSRRRRWERWSRSSCKPSRPSTMTRRPSCPTRSLTTSRRSSCGRGAASSLLNEDEQKLLEASMAYASGNPIMSDAEFDELKLKLKTNSVIVKEGPRCSLRSHKVYSDLNVDYIKMFLLNVPATTVALGLFFFIDELTGFEINVFQLPEPFGFIFTWFAALPLILFLAQSLTKAIVQDFLILKGPCPNCGTENLSFFGTILSVSSGGTTNKVKCANCSAELEYDSKSRVITLPEASNA